MLLSYHSEPTELQQGQGLTPKTSNHLMTTLDRFNLTLLKRCLSFSIVTTYKQKSGRELQKLVLLTAPEHSFAVLDTLPAPWKQ